ncbi:MAG TPA: DUF6351 family protein [Burkholderiaceae bacterium]|nr:DUF6351 family protein [Burkholderiaceae bacterium]
MSKCDVSARVGESRRSWARAAAWAWTFSALGATAAYADDGHRIHALSSRAHLVSGGDALIAVDVSRNDNSAQIELNGQDITASFQRDARSGGLVGLVGNLRVGSNTLTLLDHGEVADSLAVTNYPLSGPITSGPHITPFICQTQEFALPDGTKLGPSLDADCGAPTVIQYLYRPTGASALIPLPSTSGLPSDVASTTTLNGATVPFVVRVETSTVNRGIYQSAILHDPTSEATPSPFAPPRGWNGRLLAVEGFGCPGGWYIQGPVEGNLPGAAVLLDVTRLGEGYATFENTLQHPSNNCNAVLQDETAMMSKEHFIKTYGVPRYTVSAGCSGGSYTSLQIADNLPGMFQGVFISCTFPDPDAIAFSALDGHLLTHYFTVTNPTGFSADQQVAVAGYQGVQAWYDAANQAQRTDPVPGRVDVAGYASAVWSPDVPTAQRYDPVSNPTGARPTVFDWQRNAYGLDPATGFARRPVDNVGVQYGLQALNSGAITPTQFLDLNQRIGGYDHDDNYVATRTVGDQQAIRRTYESGLQLYGGAGLASIPVFDLSGLVGVRDTAGYHYQWFHFATRQRMIEANGNSDNHVMWRGNAIPTEQAWQVFIQWVENVHNDRAEAGQRAKVIRDKPMAAVDGCWPTSTQFIAERQVFGRLPDTQCNAVYPSYAFPRHIAGGPLAADIMKCELKPLNPGDYTVTFSAAEWARLSSIFPSGVCDWSKPGVQQRPVVPWASFGPSPENLVFDIEGGDD